MILNKNMKTSIKEIKELDREIKILKTLAKKEIKYKEKNGYEIQDYVKKTIFSLVDSINDNYSYKLIRDNIFLILSRIPDYSEKYNRIVAFLYDELLKLLSKNITNKENNTNNSILNCIININEISECYRREVTNNIETIFTIIRNSESDLKINVALNLLKNINNLHHELLESRIISVLNKIDNEKKLEHFNSLMIYIEYPKNITKLGLYIDKFLDYMKINKDDKYDENLSEIIKKLYDLICSDESPILELDMLEEILSVNLCSYNNINMKVIIKLLNSNLYKLKKINRVLLFPKILEMNFNNEEFEDMFVNILNNVVFQIEDIDLQEKLLKKICTIKSVKGLEVFKDMYPILNKYSNTEQLIGIVDELGKDIVVKKLTIPITFTLKED